MVVADFTTFQVDVGGGVEFGDHDVDVVASHSGAESRETAVLVLPCESMNLSVRTLKFNRVENVFEHIDPSWVSDKKDVVRQIVSGHINVVKAPIGSQYQFTVFYCWHGDVILWNLVCPQCCECL